MALLLAAVIALPSAASAQAYAEPGSFEVGGTFGASYARQSTAGAFGAGSTELQLSLTPEFAWFVAPGVALSLGVEGSYVRRGDTSSDESQGSHAVGLVAGLAYYAEAGRVFIGPKASFGYLTGGTDYSHGSEIGFDESTAALALLMKIPVGTGALATVGPEFAYTWETSSVSTRSPDTHRMSVRFNLGYGVHF